MRALLDSQAGEDAVAEGLDAKGNPALEQIKAAQRQEAEVDTLARSILRLLRKRGLTPTGEQRAKVLTCRDAARLERWLDATLDVESADELLSLE